MAIKEPLGHLVHDGAQCATQRAQAVEDASDEGASRRGQVSARVAFEPAPFALLGVELRAVFGQPDHLEPVSPLLQRLEAYVAGMGRAVIEHEVDLPLQGVMPCFQQLQVAPEPGAVLRRAHQLDPTASEGLDAAKHRDAPIGPGGW